MVLFTPRVTSFANSFIFRELFARSDNKVSTCTCLASSVPQGVRCTCPRLFVHLVLLQHTTVHQNVLRIIETFGGLMLSTLELLKIALLNVAVLGTSAPGLGLLVSVLAMIRSRGFDGAIEAGGRLHSAPAPSSPLRP